MKKKLLTMAFISTILTFIIYTYTKNDDITITSLGDGLSNGMTSYEIAGISFNDYLKKDYETKHQLKKYIKEFATPNITIKELIYAIKENKSITINNEKIEIKQAIHEADILTLAIGMDELKNVSITSKVRKEFMQDYQELLSLIKTLNHNQVIVLSLYPTKNHDALTINRLNAIIRDITLTNNFIFLDISSIIKSEYFIPNNDTYLNYLGHEAIYNELKKVIK